MWFVFWLALIVLVMSLAQGDLLSVALLIPVVYWARPRERA